MKQLVKKILKKLLHPLVSRLGYVQANHAGVSNEHIRKEQLLHTFYSVLKTAGFSPVHIVDVGANHGGWTKEAMTFFPDAQFTLLEPQQRLEEAIRKSLGTNNDKIRYYAVGAGSKEGRFKFTITRRDDSCNFRTTPQEAEQKGLKQIEVPVVTLDNLIKENNLPLPELVKIDAEGLDIDVLKGAKELMGKTEVFLVEAAVVNDAFENSFLNVIRFMDENGYRLFDITDLNRPFESNVLWLVELAFVKKGGKIDSHSWR